ncbi:hypothetical protein QNH48_17780 [Neobacillus sp. YX16]|uniref:hypothetical protein n=1 Tax=Neobacillus sp. YX16 TaxID=3047874 RepID=UPI0024C3FFAC|nr:hypothetical protein [Neobacillus sp. YX16]WHZ06211.1 hypothetical protein QNH48_17780 [Neobacillus sp. YX16]
MIPINNEEWMFHQKDVSLTVMPFIIKLHRFTPLDMIIKGGIFYVEKKKNLKIARNGVGKWS